MGLGRHQTVPTMTETASSIAQPDISILPIHFDVPGHYLPLETFIETARQTQSIIDGFNQELLGGELRYELYVLPPDEGSFKSKLGIAVVCGVLWGFAESDIGKAFIKGLTTHEPAYWAESIGIYLRERSKSSDIPTSAPGPVTLSQEEQSKLESLLLVEATKSFLQKDQNELSRVGITPRKFYQAYDARNQFYNACLADPQVRALGFEEAERFPIERKDFLRLQVALQPREQELPSLPWRVELTTLKVTSPNWDKEDRQRPWKARDDKNRDRYFRIDDEQFWALVRAQQINPHIIDTIKVQWAFQVQGSQRRNVRVLRVLEYNDQVLAEPLDENALSAILGHLDSSPGQLPDLFDKRD
jgi:hypothetical protein